MNLLVPDLRTKRSRRNAVAPPSKTATTESERRKGSDRRTDPAEPVAKKKGKRVWLTAKSKALVEDLFFLDEGEK